jgi:hypothetical protein
VTIGSVYSFEPDQKYGPSNSKYAFNPSDSKSLFNANSNQKPIR